MLVQNKISTDETASQTAQETDRATVRRRAVIASAAFDDARIDTLLATLVEDRDLQVRQIAEDLLADDAATDADRASDGID